MATVLEDCLGVTDGESVLIVTDPRKRAIAEALVARARELGCETVLMEMSEREQHGVEPPPQVAAAMLACDVLIAPTSKSISHTEARYAATQKGIRAATMPDVTEDMMRRTMSADYAGIKRRSRVVADLLTAGTEVRVSTGAGTNVSFEIEGREGIADDGDLRRPGAFGNLPAGEGFIAPVEGRTNGRIVFDGSISPIGLLEEPLTVEVRDGFAVEFEGAKATEFRSALEP
ncbi:MAG: aminopeptidase, partial [Actinomycetota bacterium]|nr:aminopeptidase [Actinomycetota bacterium]